MKIVWNFTSGCNIFQGQAPLPNPHGDQNVQAALMVIQPQVADILFGRTRYVSNLRLWNGLR